MNQYLKTIQDLLQQNSQLSEQEKESVIKAIADADKQWSITDFKLDRTEKVKKTTAILLEETIAELEQKRKAVEAQNRELEIESSLERVRARAMAMQKSDELKDLISTVSTELGKLDIVLDRCFIIIFDIQTMGSTWWMSHPETPSESFGLFVKYHDHPSYLAHIEAWKERKLKWQYILEGEIKETWDQFLFVETELSQLPGFVIEVMRSKKKIYLSSSFNNFGYLTLATNEPLSEEQFDIMLRFAKVFDLTYTRFNDLKQAEAQARESQIQLALERVRARTMAMQRSDELSEAASLLFQQVQSLGATQWTAGYCIFDEDKRAITLWMSGPWGDIQPPFRAPLDENPSFINYLEAHNKGLEMYIEENSAKVNEENYQYLLTLPVVGERLNSIIAKGLPLPTYQVDHCAYFSKGFLLFITYQQVPELHSVFKRFAAVFDQTYTRFLDLQKAETQARESQIQLALERVRARTMAMQHSDELADASFILDSQVRSLGIKTRGCAFNIYGENESTEWFSSEAGTMPAYKTPRENVFLRYYEEGKKGKLLYIESFEGDACAAHYDYLCTLPIMGESLKKFKERGGSFPAQQTDHVAYFKYGYLLFITLEPVPDAHDIFKRFATVFEQTYTRFLDLRKAETQAREAKIEAALEKVRSKTMAMQRSAELAEVATVLFQQVKALGVPQWTCGFSIFEIDDKEFIWYQGSADDDIQPPVKIPLTEHPVFISFNDSRKRGDELFVYEKEGEFQADHYRYMRSLPGGEEMYQNTLKAGITFPAFQIDHVANFSHGNLVFITYEHFPEMHDVFKRFAKVFDQTYTRFLDLQNAEAQAREAKIQLALERVRARTMAMQKSDELDETNKLIFRQLESLDISLSGTGIHICYADKPVSEAWMGDPLTGKMPKVIYDHTHDRLSEKMYEGWKKGETLLVEEVKGEKLKEHFEYVLPLLPDPTIYEESIQEFVFHIVYFTYGFFVLATPDHCPTEHPVFIRFAKVFDQTYTRFLDLQKAEAQAREAQIEASLERVRASAMAMHRSDELSNVLAVLFEQFDVLKIQPVDVHLDLFDLEKNTFSYRATGKEGKRVIAEQIVDLDSRPEWQALLEKWKKGKPNTVDFSFYPKEVIRELMAFFPDIWAAMPEDAIMSPEDFPDGIFDALGFCKFGYIGFHHHRKATEEEQRILIRFANEFERLYQRFLDLQKAEAQAREAIKQASVDRVRAEIASMRTTHDLERIQPLIWTELKILGIPFIRCGVFIMDEQKQEVQTMLSTPEGKGIATLHVPFEFDLSIITNGVDNWRRKKIYKEHWDAAAFTQTWIKLSSLRANSLDAPPVEHPPESLYLHLLPFLQGMLYVGNDTPLNDDELNLVQNLADAFATAYARYEDFNKLEAAKKQVDSTLDELQTTQKQLIQSEKMASLGELTAGIAHEIQNPLNFVNNFSEVNKELLGEMKDEIEKGNMEEVKAIANDIIGNEEKISHHGKRADAIVKGMLQHSRSTSTVKEPADINALADEYLRLSYHGLRAKDKSFNATMKTDFDGSIGTINIIPQDIGRVLLNLYNNSFYAVSEKKKQQAKNYEPTVSIKTRKLDGEIELSVKDNGNGIPQKLLDKIFQPFFTTKPTGQGTGLGLSLAYDIVKAHGGELKVDTKEGVGSEFIIRLRTN